METLQKRVNCLITARCGDGHGRFSCFSGLTGINAGTIRAWIKRGITRLSPENVKAICMTCDVAPDWLLYGSPEHIPDFGVDNPAQRGDDYHKLSDISLPECPNEIGVLQRIPIISYAMAGVDGFSADPYEVGTGEDYVMHRDTGDPSAFALVVRGDSMIPKYHDGDIVFISPEKHPTNGRPCMVKLQSEEVTLKIWHEQGDIVMLKSLNQSYQDRAVRKSEIEKAYKIVGMDEGG